METKMIADNYDEDANYSYAAEEALEEYREAVKDVKEKKHEYNWPHF